MYLERATFVTGEKSAIADRRSWAVTRCRWSESASCGSPSRRPAHQWTPMERSAARSVRAPDHARRSRSVRPAETDRRGRVQAERQDSVARLPPDCRTSADPVSDPARPAMSAAGQPGTPCCRQSLVSLGYRTRRTPGRVKPGDRSREFRVACRCRALFGPTPGFGLHREQPAGQLGTPSRERRAPLDLT